MVDDEAKAQTFFGDRGVGVQLGIDMKIGNAIIVKNKVFIRVKYVSGASKSSHTNHFSRAKREMRAKMKGRESRVTKRVGVRLVILRQPEDFWRSHFSELRSQFAMAFELNGP
jgi:hypothetical protein